MCYKPTDHQPHAATVHVVVVVGLAKEGFSLNRWDCLQLTRYVSMPHVYLSACASIFGPCSQKNAITRYLNKNMLWRAGEDCLSAGGLIGMGKCILGHTSTEMNLKSLQK
jgi:hypothetical protein